ncbi:MAG TPA: DnaD domain protein [Candidatus Limosilactobacillus faecipullorum]|nr:DnaD domain protein [Candidatus Limosilactobacillus faecipullorum]
MIERAPLTPKTGYLVSANPKFVGLLQASFLPFYQPLLGADALGLFLALSDLIRPNPVLAKRQLVSTLLVRLNIGLPAFSRALDRLEGLRLIKTYQLDDELGVTLVLEVQPPLTPVELINDDLLSVLLLQQVGANEFNHLVQRAKENFFDPSHLKQVTKNFFTVFKPDSSTQAEDDQTITEARQALPIDQVASLTIPAEDFDFNFFLRQADSLGVPEDQLQEARKLVLAEHRLYGFDELQLANLASRATDLATNKFNQLTFKNEVQRASQPVRSKSQVVNGNEDVTGFSQPMRELVQLANQLAPVPFLKQIKEQKGGFVTPAEQRVLTEIGRNSNLPGSVLNILSWYLLVDQGMDNLVANLATSIASSWQAKGINSAAQALRQAQSHQEKQRERFEQRQNRRSSNYGNKRPRIKEELPEWAKQSAQPTKGKKGGEVDPKQVAEMKKMLANLNQQQNDK